MTAPRPDSLAEVARRTLGGAVFRMELADFLDEFYLCPTAQALAEEPVILAGSVDRGHRKDVYLGATAEHLGRRFQFGLAPWVYDPRRYLDKPSFAMKTREGRIFLLKDSPAAFKSRNLFVTGNVLSRV